MELQAFFLIKWSTSECPLRHEEMLQKKCTVIGLRQVNIETIGGRVDETLHCTVLEQPKEANYLTKKILVNGVEDNKKLCILFQKPQWGKIRQFI